MRYLSLLLLMISMSTSAIAFERIEDRIKVVGTISSQTSGGTALAVVVMKDTRSDKTHAVQVGRPFIIDKKVYSVKTITSENVIITDGVELYALEHHDSSFPDPIAVDEDQYMDEMEAIYAQEEYEKIEAGYYDDINDLRTEDIDEDDSQVLIDDTEYRSDESSEQISYYDSETD